MAARCFNGATGRNRDLKVSLKPQPEWKPSFRLLLFKEADVFDLLKTFEENYSFRVSKELIKSQNWNEVWEKNYFKPLVVAGECLVRAPFHKEFPQCKYEIVIEPNMAFGTGNHETTSMMLEAILKENLTGKKVLDMGCGTGILGILASMKGASEITAIDIDEWSVKGTYENAALNNIKNLKVKKGDASLLGTKNTISFLPTSIKMC
jgi:ribosomal protein L11 methyltransferase